MIPASVLTKMATIGLSPEQAEAVAGMLSEVEAATLASADERREAGKEKARERWRRWKANQQQANDSKRLQTAANASKPLTRVEDNNLTTVTSGEEGKKATSPSARSSSGTRIPDDFQPDIEAAVSEGVPREEAMRQARSFCDYWRAKPGKDGRKLDWPATWRVWYRRHVPTRSTQAQAPPKDQRKPRNAGELSRMQLQAMEGNNAPDFPTGYLNASDGNADHPGTGIARRFAIASSR